MPAPTTVASNPVRDFVKLLAKRGANDIEKLLVHLLDTAAGHWNKKATRLLTEMKRSDLTKHQVSVLQKQYEEAYDNAHRIIRMRHGCSISKRTL